MTNSIPLHIPDDVMDKIKYLCKHMPKEEWSGVLFYAVEGSIQKTGNVKITIKDLYLMDKGTGGATAFDWDETIVEYRMNHMETIDYKIGHIHSHNTMQVFFSGTDWEELNDNCPLHNYYLSVIVNNFMDIKAKIAFTGIQAENYTCKDENGKDYVIRVKSEHPEVKMLVYDCEVFTSVHTVTVAEEFDTRMKLVMEASTHKAEKAAEQWKKNHPAGISTGTGGYPLPAQYPPTGKPAKYWDGKKKDPFPDYDPSKKSSKENYLDNQFIMDKWGKKPVEEKMDVDETKDLSDIPTIEEEFAACLIRLGNEVEQDTIEEALGDLDYANINNDAVVDVIVSNYGVYHANFFAKLPKYHGDEMFLDTLGEVIRLYEEVDERNYPFITDLIHKLTLLGNRLEYTLQNKELIT